MSIASEIHRIETEVAAQTSLISQIRTALKNKVADGGEDYTPVLQEKSVTPSKSVQTVTAETGYDGLSQVTVEAIPDEYIIPSGSLSTDKNGTYDVTEKESVVVNVASGGDSDEEIDALVGLFDDTTTEFESTRITKLVQYAFAYRNCASISLPNLKSTAARVFTNCDNMTSLSIPNMTGATNTYMAAYCSAMKTCDVKNASSISTYSFYGCSNLTKMEFNRITSIAGNSFNGCSKLATLILRSSSLVTLSATSAFTSTKIAGTGGYVYVPASLRDQYVSASNWSTYGSDKFRAIEDYPDICG